MKIANQMGDFDHGHWDDSEGGREKCTQGHAECEGPVVSVQADCKPLEGKKHICLAYHYAPVPLHNSILSKYQWIYITKEIVWDFRRKKHGQKYKPSMSTTMSILGCSLSIQTHHEH